jgi:trehalose-6-phosphatase
VSSRPWRDLENGFGFLEVAMVAEHGVWLRHKGADWCVLTTISVADLANYARNIDEPVLEGKKVVEVRNSGVTKCAAAIG